MRAATTGSVAVAGGLRLENTEQVIAAGGKPYDGPGGGHYVEPTLVTGAHAKMRVAQEEVFGPFLTVIPFRDEEEAWVGILTANGSVYCAGADLKEVLQDRAP